MDAKYEIWRGGGSSLIGSIKLKLLSGFEIRTYANPHYLIVINLGLASSWLRSAAGWWCWSGEKSHWATLLCSLLDASWIKWDNLVVYYLFSNSQPSQSSRSFGLDKITTRYNTTQHSGFRIDMIASLHITQGCIYQWFYHHSVIVVWDERSLASLKTLVHTDLVGCPIDPDNWTTRREAVAEASWNTHFISQRYHYVLAGM